MKFTFKIRYFLFVLPYLFLLPFVFAKFFGTGMNFDGTLYAAISRNLTLQNSFNFWSLQTVNSVQENFYDHPPLGFWLQSLFFRLLGDHRFTEKIYTAVMGILLVYIIGKTWDALTKKPEFKWVSQLFLVLCPAFCTIIKNNWLEGPMMVFMLSSTIFMVYAFEALTQVKRSLWAFFSGTFVVCAILIKPPVPFVLFSFWCLIYFIKYKSNHKEFFLQSILFASPFIGFCFYVYFDPIAYAFVKQYFNNQVVASLNGQRDIVNPHFMVLKFLFLDFIIPVLVFSLLFLTQKKKYKVSFGQLEILLFICALAASLPLVISSKNMNRYLVPSYPFYAYALILMFLNYFSNIQKKIDLGFYKNHILFVAVLIFGVGLSLSSFNFGKIVKSNQKNYFETFANLQLPKDLSSMSTVSADPINNDWEFRNNFTRDHTAIFINYGVGNGKYRLYSMPFVSTPPVGCLSLPHTQNKNFKIFDCSSLKVSQN